jgi:hypothetical protein
LQIFRGELADRWLYFLLFLAVLCCSSLYFFAVFCCSFAVSQRRKSRLFAACPRPCKGNAKNFGCRKANPSPAFCAWARQITGADSTG